MLKNIALALGIEKVVTETPCYEVSVVKTPWSKSIKVIDPLSGYVYMQKKFKSDVSYETIFDAVASVFDYSDENATYEEYEVEYFNYEKTKVAMEILCNEEILPLVSGHAEWKKKFLSNVPRKIRRSIDA